jgi:hypothetical protein
VVRRVELAGSRSRGTHGELSDWDFAVMTSDFAAVARDLPAVLPRRRVRGRRPGGWWHSRASRRGAHLLEPVCTAGSIPDRDDGDHLPARGSAARPEGTCGHEHAVPSAQQHPGRLDVILPQDPPLPRSGGRSGGAVKRRSVGRWFRRKGALSTCAAADRPLQASRGRRRRRPHPGEGSSAVDRAPTAAAVPRAWIAGVCAAALPRGNALFHGRMRNVAAELLPRRLISVACTGASLPAVAVVRRRRCAGCWYPSDRGTSIRAALVGD